MLGAGNSSRFDMPVKKQWLRINDEPLWQFVTKKISKMYNFDKIIVVCHKQEQAYMKKFANYTFCEGGHERQESLKKALDLVDSEFVLVSDIARVCIKKRVVKSLIKSRKKASCIVPILKATDTIHYQNVYINRDEIKLIQTPQLSHTKDLKKALKNETLFTDDSSAILASGKKVHYIKGHEKSFKLTTKKDLKKLTNLKKPSKDIFIGNGFDVHEFGEKRALLLGGICVHESLGVKAHSDGDVLAHALIDAILGASSLGDIGELFPDHDKRYKNANSMELLKQVSDFVRQVGFEFVNIDITILAQKPKIGPYKQQIAKNIATHLHIKENKINIKATTTEKLGFIGRSEGLGVQATAGLKYFNWKRT